MHHVPDPKLTGAVFPIDIAPSNAMAPAFAGAILHACGGARA